MDRHTLTSQGEHGHTMEHLGRKDVLYKFDPRQ